MSKDTAVKSGGESKAVLVQARSKVETQVAATQLISARLRERNGPVSVCELEIQVSY